ncbi:hypothetical protein BDR06DRAFT_241950 [Suillus hirtellus]|nr:hypothetical protein BDR06DRAFT_241950 [Suillus hirtellus]
MKSMKSNSESTILKCFFFVPLILMNSQSVPWRGLSIFLYHRSPLRRQHGLRVLLHGHSISPASRDPGQQAFFVPPSPPRALSSHL